MKKVGHFFFPTSELGVMLFDWLRTEYFNHMCWKNFFSPKSILLGADSPHEKLHTPPRFPLWSPWVCPSFMAGRPNMGLHLIVEVGRRRLVSFHQPASPTLPHCHCSTCSNVSEVVSSHSTLSCILLKSTLTSHLAACCASVGSCFSGLLGLPYALGQLGLVGPGLHPRSLPAGHVNNSNDT